MPYFVVVSEQGPAWAQSVDMCEQQDWAGHASFMNALAEEEFVVLGGPIGDQSLHRARLVVRSSSKSEVRDRLAADPWVQKGILTTKTIEEWDVLLSVFPDD